MQQTGVQDGPAYPVGGWAGGLGRLQDMVTFRTLARRRRERRDRQAAPLRPLRAEPQLVAVTGLPDVAAVGTGLDRLWQQCPRGMATLEEAYLRGQCYLHPRDWELCRQMIVAELSTALRLPADAAQAATTILDPLAARMCEFVDRAAEKWARRLYARGLIGGVIASMVLLVVLSVGILPLISAYHGLARGHARLPSSGEVIAVRDTLACILGGSAGAVVSVLFRLRRIRWLDYEAMDARTAWYRIVTGWFFALGVLFLVKGGIVTVFRDPSGDLMARGATGGEWVSSWFFWGGVGFLAGLNESWTKNLFSRDSLAERDERKATARRP
ncbi:MAG: hypothetical protein ACJ73S_32125 [Mycobacteriales bacterium]